MFLQTDKPNAGEVPPGPDMCTRKAPPKKGGVSPNLLLHSAMRRCIHVFACRLAEICLFVCLFTYPPANNLALLECRFSCERVHAGRMFHLRPGRVQSAPREWNVGGPLEEGKTQPMEAFSDKLLIRTLFAGSENTVVSRELVLRRGSSRQGGMASPPPALHAGPAQSALLTLTPHISNSITPLKTRGHRRRCPYWGKGEQSRPSARLCFLA